MAKSLVTLAEYKAYSGISSNTQDVAISAIIPKVSALVKSICRRTFVDYVDDAKVEVINGGYDKLYMKEYPLISITSFEVSQDYGVTYTELVEYTDYVLDIEEGSIANLVNTYFPKKINGYKITYTAGYETIPEDLKMAVLDLITYYIKNESAIHSPKAPGTNSVQIEYVTTTNLPSHIKRVLDLHTGSYD